MNLFNKAIIILLFVAASAGASAQDNGVTDIIKEGVQLNDQGNYAGAIDKFNQALKVEPENAQANYEMAFSLFLSGKGNDGISYIEKTLKASTSLSLTAASYDLLGS
ncbi:MAG: tetratricopeptide repeat protein, partial [Mucilaginibacter sp.]